MSHETSGYGERGRTAGSMTAVMRAAPPGGPKVLRIGIVREGRIVEERTFAARATVTLGPSEDATFVVPASALPGDHELLEPARTGYHLHVPPGATGRAALSDEIVDLEAKRGETLLLGGDARGKVVVGGVTLLFQLVAPRPPEARPRLPASTMRGTFGVDWPTTIIAAVSFLLHFGVIGTSYSDWLDPITDDDIVVSGVVETLRTLPPAEVESPTNDVEPRDTRTEPKTSTPTPAPIRSSSVGDRTAPTTSRSDAAALNRALDGLAMATLVALSSTGAATENVLRGGEVPTSLLDDAARRDVGVGPFGGSSTATVVRPGTNGGTLADIGNTGASTRSDSGTTRTLVGPTGTVDPGPTKVAGTLTGAAGVIAGLRAGFRRCYQNALGTLPDASGKISLSIRVGPGGEVQSIGATTSGNLPASLVSCVTTRARSAQFDAPQGGLAVVQVPVSFVKQ